MFRDVCHRIPQTSRNAGTMWLGNEAGPGLERWKRVSYDEQLIHVPNRPPFKKVAETKGLGVDRLSQPALGAGP
jgi:hypothetical protein